MAKQIIVNAAKVSHANISPRGNHLKSITKREAVPKTTIMNINVRAAKRSLEKKRSSKSRTEKNAMIIENAASCNIVPYVRPKPSEKSVLVT
jgi:hypothetical protein